MTDLKNEKWLWIEGFLFVLVAMLSMFLLLADFTSPRQFVLCHVCHLGTLQGLLFLLLCDRKVH